MRALLVMLAATVGATSACCSGPIGGTPAAPAVGLRLNALQARAWLLDAEAFGRRDAGQMGAERAAHYLAAELQAAGLQPAGTDGTYLQEVPLAIDQAEPRSLVVVRGPTSMSLMPDHDYVILEAHGEMRLKIDAEAVLADQAVGGAVRRRAAVVTVPRLDEPSRVRGRVDRVRNAGAAAVLVCVRRAAGQTHFAKLREQLQRPTVRLAERTAGGRPQVTAAAATQLVFLLAPPACEQLLAPRGGAAKGPLLPFRIRAHADLVRRPGRTFNTIAVLPLAARPGGTPALVAARLDGPGRNLAALLEVATALRRHDERPPRPVRFLAYAAAAGEPLGLTHFRRTAGRDAPTVTLDLAGLTWEQAQAACRRAVAALVADGPSRPPSP